MPSRPTNQGFETLPTFKLPFAPMLYDQLVRFLYLPGGGERSFRAAAIHHMDVRRGERVLELGCGTGSFTRLMLAAGAEVTAVDGAPAMIARAKSRAPGGTFHVRDLRDLKAKEFGTFDTVFFGFVLHELAPEARLTLLRWAANALQPGGRVVIVDHAIPSGRGFPKLWRQLLLRLEPPYVRKVIEQGYESELLEAGLQVERTKLLARGMASLSSSRVADSPST